MKSLRSQTKGRKEHAIATRKKARPTVKALLKLVQTSLDADKAEKIVTIDVAGRTSMADFMVIATGGSHRQLGAMTGHLVEKLKAKGVPAVPVEGLSQGDWVLVDAGDIIVHLFRAEQRALYNLEKMWSVDLPEQSAAMTA